MAGLLFWLVFAAALAFGYFLPLRALRGYSGFKAARTSVFLFVDSPGFALALALNAVLLIVVSAAVAFLLPGPAAAVLAYCEATRLRLAKLDWLVTTGASRSGQVPWKTILADDIDRLGHRRLVELIFPWKK